MKHKSPILFLGMFALLTLGLTACQSASGPVISVENAWGRPSPQAATTGAFYMTIKNSGNAPDTLLAASTDSCGAVELHESYDMGDGVMGMRPVEGGVLEIPAGGQTELKMGGLHIMCMDIQGDFQEGAMIPLTLEFEKSGEMTVNVEIRQPDM